MRTCDSCVGGFETPASVGRDGKWSCGWELQSTPAAHCEAARSCFFCEAVWRSLDIPAHAQNQADIVLPLKYVFRQGHKDGALDWLSICARVGKSPTVYFLLEDTRLNYRSINQVKGISTGCVEPLRFLERQLSLCRSTHAACCDLVSKDKWYPTRLVEVRDGKARLIISKETEPTGPYLSLSHRWGTGTIFQCTSKTIGGLITNIPVTELPVTFQDAFHAAEYLGFKYLWIDSLCIIQDSAQDWSREAKTMKQIYQRAYMNLAATTSLGLFRKRDPESMMSDPFRVHNGILAGDFRAVEAVLDRDPWDSTIENAPLNLRAWVMQERLLSSRVAHFTARQIVWDCLENTASESNPSGQLAQPFVESIWIGRKQGSTILRPPRDIDTGIGQWATVVNAYSRCGLTYYTDKFVAVGGVAEYLSRLFKDDYHCGLFRSQMELQLCWFSIPDNGQPLSSNDIAPSWSWMSINGPVETPQPQLYQGYALKFFARIDDVSTQHSQRDETTEAYTGSLQMWCSLNAVELVDESTQPRLIGRGTEHVAFVNLDVSHGRHNDGELYVVPIFEVQDPMTIEWKYRYSEVRGLLLRLIDGASGTYIRCGHVGLRSHSNRETGRFADSWMALLSAQGKGQFPCQVFDVEAGHLIKVV
ncbi:hypothetical protein JX266_010804 [Neoarthrinium moseri]|nr:hypothetical protein JX266_010804 [Neoarthrinium moseri]